MVDPAIHGTDPDAGRSGARNGPSGHAIRIANCSGFYGDQLDAARLMVDGGPIDALTGTGWPS